MAARNWAAATPALYPGSCRATPSGSASAGDVMNHWLRQKISKRKQAIAKEWQEIVGHDRDWWQREARKTRTDMSSLLQQRIRVWQWVRAGRPPLAGWLRACRETQDA